MQIKIGNNFRNRLSGLPDDFIDDLKYWIKEYKK